MRRQKKQRHFGLLLMFVLVLFAAGLVNSGITTLAVYMLVQNGVLQFSADVVPDAGRLMLFNMLLSIPVCLLVSAAVSKFPLKPVRDLIDGMDRLASGDFKTRISVGKIMRRYPAYVEVSRSFNKMAEELESTEMLRSDFINNFSHELSLTKVENQTILTDVTEYNLSEQIRACMLILESKWIKKDIELQLDFGEFSVRASEELLKQVWINLLDNAVKFTPDGHTIQVRIEENEHILAVEIRNTGSEIPAESQGKIFNKFYQADESHAAQGNGVGLAIVKRVTDLHGGRVSVSSGNGVTAFRVELPK